MEQTQLFNKLRFVSILLLLFSSFSHGSEHSHLQGQQIWRVSGKKISEIIPNLLEIHPSVDLLYAETENSVHLRLNQDDQKHILNFIADENIEAEVTVEDLSEHMIAHDAKELKYLSSRSEPTDECIIEKCNAPLSDQYMTFQQMEFYLKNLESRYPHVKITSIGKSAENRDIWLVTMISSADEGKEKTSVWIEGGIHAREWIATSTSFHMIEKLAQNYDHSLRINYYIAPMANPDGYEYSRTTNRFWRKSRSVHTNSNCAGVDLNRNWDLMFALGASNDPCSDVYMGTKAFSEPETKALSDAMIKANKTNNLNIVLSLHSYGNILLYPWGYTKEPIPNKDYHQAAGNAFIEAAKQIDGTKFTVENSAAGLYFASGATDDWSKGILASTLVYTVELRAGTTENGFCPSVAEIKPTADEFYAGFIALLEYYKNNPNRN